jgi:cardiolipin synthase
MSIMERSLDWNPPEGTRRAARPWIGAWLLVLLGGCRTPPAHFAPLEPGASPPACGRQFACQLVADSAVALTCHPLRTSLELVAEPADHLVGVGRGAVRKRLVMALRTTPPSLPPLPPPDPAVWEAAGPERKDFQPAQLQLYPEGGEALAVLENLIDQATCRIDVLMFQWENDGLGQDIASHLAAKAGPRLRVRVLVDSAGNLLFGQPDPPDDPDVNRVIRELAQKPYVEVIRSRYPFARFDHRKLVLIDGRTAWTGGRNFRHGAFFGQRDLSFTVEGPLVAELEELFEQSWREQGGAPRERQATTAVMGTVNAQARLVQTQPPLTHQIERAVFDAVDHARHHVYLENFTFCDNQLLDKLSRARQRNVDVRVVLTVSATPDTINRANRVTAKRLLHAGVRVYVYPEMTHMKAAAVDGGWAYLGTGNFDPLSLRHNRELGLIVRGGPVVSEVEERLFQADFCPEWELKQPFPVSVGDYFWEMVSSLFL